MDNPYVLLKQYQETGDESLLKRIAAWYEANKGTPKGVAFKTMYDSANATVKTEGPAPSNKASATIAAGLSGIGRNYAAMNAGVQRLIQDYADAELSKEVAHEIGADVERQHEAGIGGIPGTMIESMITFGLDPQNIIPIGAAAQGSRAAARAVLPALMGSQTALTEYGETGEFGGKEAAKTALAAAQGLGLGEANRFLGPESGLKHLLGMGGYMGAEHLTTDPLRQLIDTGQVDFDQTLETLPEAFGTGLGAGAIGAMSGGEARKLRADRIKTTGTEVGLEVQRMMPDAPLSERLKAAAEMSKEMYDNQTAQDVHLDGALRWREETLAREEAWKVVKAEEKRVSEIKAAEEQERKAAEKQQEIETEALEGMKPDQDTLDMNAHSDRLARFPSSDNLPAAAVMIQNLDAFLKDNKDIKAKQIRGIKAKFKADPQKISLREWQKLEKVLGQDPEPILRGEVKSPAQQAAEAAQKAQEAAQQQPPAEGTPAQETAPAAPVAPPQQAREPLNPSVASEYFRWKEILSKVPFWRDNPEALPGSMQRVMAAAQTYAQEKTGNAYDPASMREFFDRNVLRHLDTFKGVDEDMGLLATERKMDAAGEAATRGDEDVLQKIVDDVEAKDRQRLILSVPDGAEVKGMMIPSEALAGRTKQKVFAHEIPDLDTITYLFDKADPSTLIHELFHVTEIHASDPTRNALGRWVGKKPDDWTSEDREALAEAFESYVITGKIPKGMDAEARAGLQEIRERMAAIGEQVKVKDFKGVKGEPLEKARLAGIFSRIMDPTVKSKGKYKVGDQVFDSWGAAQDEAWRQASHREALTGEPEIPVVPKQVKESTTPKSSGEEGTIVRYQGDDDDLPMGSFGVVTKVKTHPKVHGKIYEVIYFNEDLGQVKPVIREETSLNKAASVPKSLEASPIFRSVTDVVRGERNAGLDEAWRQASHREALTGEPEIPVVPKEIVASSDPIRRVASADYQSLSGEQRGNLLRNISQFGWNPSDFNVPEDVWQAFKASRKEQAVSTPEPVDDGYYYHVTTPEAAKEIVAQGRFSTSGVQTMAPGSFADYSRGKVFFTDRGGVRYWKERIGSHLEHQGRNTELVVLRVPKEAVGRLKVDSRGTGDSRNPAWVSDRPVRSREITYAGLDQANSGSAPGGADATGGTGVGPAAGRTGPGGGGSGADVLIPGAAAGHVSGEARIQGAENAGPVGMGAGEVPIVPETVRPPKERRARKQKTIEEAAKKGIQKAPPPLTHLSRQQVQQAANVMKTGAGDVAAASLAIPKLAFDNWATPYIERVGQMGKTGAYVAHLARRANDFYREFLSGTSQAYREAIVKTSYGIGDSMGRISTKAVTRGKSRAKKEALQRLMAMKDIETAGGSRVRTANLYELLQRRLPAGMLEQEKDIVKSLWKLTKAQMDFIEKNGDTLIKNLGGVYEAYKAGDGRLAIFFLDPGFRDVLTRGDSALIHEAAKAIMDFQSHKTGIPAKKGQLEIFKKDLESFSKGIESEAPFEQRRLIREMPSEFWSPSQERWVRLLETNPAKYAMKLQSSQAQRYGFLKSFGQALPDNARIKPGVKVPVRQHGNFKTAKQAFLRENGSNGMEMFDDLVRTLNNIPVDQVPEFATPRSSAYNGMRVVNMFNTIYRAGLLSGSWLPNVTETLGADLAHSGWKDWAAAWKEIGSNRELAMERTAASGARTQEISDTLYDPHLAPESIGRKVGAFLTAPSRWMNEMNELHAATVGRLVKERIQEGRAYKMDAVTLEHMGFSPKERAALLDGTAPDSLYHAIETRYAGFLMGSTSTASEKSKFASSRQYRAWIAFDSYAQMKANRLHKSFADMYDAGKGLALDAFGKKALTPTEKAEKIAKAKAFAQINGYQALSGAGSMLLRAMVAGGVAGGVGSIWRRTKEDTAKTLGEMYLSASAGGPLQAFLNAAFDDKEKHWYEDLLHASVTFNIFDQLNDWWKGDGRFRDQDVVQKSITLLSSSVPITKQIYNTVGVYAFGEGSEEKDRWVATERFWRYMRNHDLIPGGSFPIDEEDRAFRIHMKKAYQMIVDGTDDQHVRDSILRALGTEGKSAESVRKSLLGRRYLPKIGDAARYRDLAERAKDDAKVLEYDQKAREADAKLEELRAYIGDEAFQKLQSMDDLLTRWAEAYREEEDEDDGE